jgi:ribosomal-protein-alanine N-acetyltransferase
MMESMLYRDEASLAIASTTSMAMPYVDVLNVPERLPVVTSDWRAGLPLLAGAGVTLRELRASDARALFAMLTTEEVSRFISPPPTTVEGFERFIAWTIRQRIAGEYVCFGIVPDGSDSAIGLIQIRARDGRWDTAEWGFAIGSPYWGTGVFVAAANAALDFTFYGLGVHRLEARSAVKNGRGTGALRKLGAVEEAVLRKSLLIRGEYLDQVLWTLWRPESSIKLKAVWTLLRLH